MSLSAKQAAERTGMSKQGIIKAIRQGKLTATKDAHGQWCIDPAELFRVYPPVDATEPSTAPDTPPVNLRQYTPPVVAVLKREIVLLQDRLADKTETIQDLRKRLDDATQERHEISHAAAEERQRLSLLLTHQAERQPPPPKGFWAWLFG